MLLDCSRRGWGGQTGSLILELSAQTCFATATGFPIFESKRTAVSFRNLPAQNQANSGSALLRGEKRHEKVGRVWNARAFILHPSPDRAVLAFPAHMHAAARL